MNHQIAPFEYSSRVPRIHLQHRPCGQAGLPYTRQPPLVTSVYRYWAHRISAIAKRAPLIQRLYVGASIRLRIVVPYMAAPAATAASGRVIAHCIAVTPPAEASVTNCVALPTIKQMFSACTNMSGGTS